MAIFRKLTTALNFCSLLASAAMAHEETVVVDKPDLRSLMTHALDGADGFEVVVSHAAFPPDMSLPEHWHPGEGIVYVVRGSFIPYLDAMAEQHFAEGDATVVPLRLIHYGKSGPEVVTHAVFGVHQDVQHALIPVGN